MRRLWQRTNTVDRLYLGYFFVLGSLITVQRHRVPGWPQVLALHLLGMAVIVVLAAAAHRSRVLRFLHDWYPLLAFIVCFEEIARFSFLLVNGWRDAYLLELEARLFSTPPTVWVQRFASPLVTEILEIGYFSYFTLLMIVGGALYGRADPRPFRQVMTASVLSYFLCYLLYLLFPTEGPAYTLAAQYTVAFRGGPFHALVGLIQKHAGVHGNAFPSSHVAAAVVVLVFAWRHVPRLGAALTPFVILLCIGAVYDRYHYASDIPSGILVGLVACGPVLWRARGAPGQGAG